MAKELRNTDRAFGVGVKWGLKELKEELYNEEDAKNEMTQCIRENFFYEPFTLDDLVEALGWESAGKEEKDKKKKSMSDNLVVNVKNILGAMVQAGVLEEEDGSYKLTETEREKLR
ncbi:MAG: hypothetical protein AAB408_00715 [Patescibacteria group bacterium]